MNATSTRRSRSAGMTGDSNMTDGNKRPKQDDEAFKQAVQRTAYFLWEQDGRPHGRHEEYYLKALELHRRERTYDDWLTDDPDGE